MDLKAAFSDLAKMDLSGGGKYPKIKSEGDHLIEVVKITSRPSHKTKEHLYIVEFKVLETTCDDVTVGSQYSWKHDLDNKWYGIPRVVQFLAACAGHDVSTKEGREWAVENVEASDLTGSYSDEQPLKGARLRVHTEPTKTEKGFDFTAHTFTPE